MTKGDGMAWIYLIIAGLLEVVWASWLKKTDGFTRLGPSLSTIGVKCVSFYLLGVALKTLPTGTGYAVWVGIGAVGTALGVRGINVNGLYVGQDKDKGVALELWCVDSPLDEQVIAEIRALAPVSSAQVVRL